MPFITDQTDPSDGRTLSQYSLGAWQNILLHLAWQAQIAVAGGTTKMVDQSSWIEDSASAGQEYVNIDLKQP